MSSVQAQRGWFKEAVIADSRDSPTHEGCHQQAHQDAGHQAPERHLDEMGQAGPRRSYLPPRWRLLHPDQTFPDTKPPSLNVEALSVKPVDMNDRSWPAIAPANIYGHRLGRLK